MSIEIKIAIEKLAEAFYPHYLDFNQRKQVEMAISELVTLIIQKQSQ